MPSTGCCLRDRRIDDARRREQRRLDDSCSRADEIAAAKLGLLLRERRRLGRDRRRRLRWARPSAASASAPAARPSAPAPPPREPRPPSSPRGRRRRLLELLALDGELPLNLGLDRLRVDRGRRRNGGRRGGNGGRRGRGRRGRHDPRRASARRPGFVNFQATNPTSATAATTIAAIERRAALRLRFLDARVERSEDLARCGRFPRGDRRGRRAAAGSAGADAPALPPRESRPAEAPTGGGRSGRPWTCASWRGSGSASRSAWAAASRAFESATAVSSAWSRWR